MANIRARHNKDGKITSWQARVIRKGYPDQVKSFGTKRSAEIWARNIESEMDKGVFVSRAEAERTTLKDLLERYVREILPSKKSQQAVRSVAKILNEHLGKRSVASITPSVLASYRDTRLETGITSQTVRHELALLSRLFNLASKEWGMALPMGNPTLQIRMPAQSKARDRRLVGDEETRLLAACAGSRNPWLRPVVIFAIETAMRSGEILETWKSDGDDKPRKITSGLMWTEIDLANKVATLPLTKNGEIRRVPLSPPARDVLRSLPRSLDGRVFETTYEAVHQSFVRACRRVNISDLRFHDLRHEATSRFFERGFNPMQVATITGHKTLQMLKRYTHLKAEDLADMMETPQFQRPS
ncbi:MAG: site-specific integrase [Gammaproteobacteria bacterium]|nr:site-specific integrase [Gammaproteobacteria bacterium]